MIKEIRKKAKKSLSLFHNIFVVIDIISDFLNKSNIFMNFKNEILSCLGKEDFHCTKNLNSLLQKRELLPTESQKTLGLHQLYFLIGKLEKANLKLTSLCFWRSTSMFLLNIFLKAEKTLNNDQERRSMNELIPINYDDEEPTISARDLHKALDVQSRFSRWFDSNKELFVEGEDYNKCTSSTVVNNGAVRELEDYKITVLMAKHLAMMSRTEKGKQIRDYLIDLEKAWNTPEQVFARALKMADQTIAKLKDTNKSLVEKIEADRPKTIFADAVSASHTSILIGDLAKLICQNGYQIGQKRLFQWMRDNGYLMVSGSSRNMPKQKYVEQGLFEIKESNVQNPDGSVRITRTTKVSGKGQLYFVNKFLGQETEREDGD